MQSRSRLQPERLWLLLGIIWVVASTLAPFTLSFAPNELPLRITQALQVEPGTPFKDAGHIISFFVLGIIIACNLARSAAGWIGPVIMIIFGCIALETAQLFQAGRHARLTDLVLNVAGGSGGFAFAFGTAAGRRLCDKLSAWTWPRPVAPAVLLVGALLVWSIVGLQPMFGALRLDWDRTFPLLVGNELGAPRQWSGQLRYAGIYGRALSRSDVRELYQHLNQPNLSQSRRQQHLLVGYDFRRSPTERLKSEGELSDDTLALDLPANLAWSGVDGITLVTPTLLRTPESVTRLTDRIMSLDAFSVETWARPANLVQTGPARLISSSPDIAFRNFTLGPSGPNLVFRVRDPLNGLNGTDYELTARSVVTTTWQHYVATYDHGISTIYVDGVPRAVVNLREPTVYYGLGPGGFARAAMMMLAVLTISLPATFVFAAHHKFRTACLGAAVLTFIGGALPYLITCYGLDAPRPMGFVGSFLLALLIYPFGLFFVLRAPRFSATEAQKLQHQL